MNVTELRPKPDRREPFRRNRHRFIPRVAGCYALTTFEGVVLYVGLSKNLQNRFGTHLDSPEKTAKTSAGRAVFFYWVKRQDIACVERTWLQCSELADGALPPLNRAQSPVQTL